MQKASLAVAMVAQGEGMLHTMLAQLVAQHARLLWLFYRCFIAVWPLYCPSKLLWLLLAKTAHQD